MNPTSPPPQAPMPHASSHAPCPMPHASSHERGMALLFSLGILAMMLVLALVFATTAMIDQKVAASYNDTVRARMIARSAIERTMMMLKYNEDGKAVLGSPSNEWHYITANINGVDQYIGRFKYDREVAGPRLDPSVTVNHVAGAGNNESTISELRPGAALDEVNLDNLGGVIGGYSGNMSNSSAGGLLPIMTRWPDYNTMFTALGISLDPLDPTHDQFKKWFVVGDPQDAEAFWIDGGSSNKANEMYHRFDLARTNMPPYSTAIPATDWDSASMDVDDILKNAQPFVAVYDGSGGIPWLKNYAAVDGGNLQTGTFASATTRAKQIAANLIDYCDGNNTPTSNVNYPGWDDASYSADFYTGNEKTPFINEITVDIEAECVITPSGTDYNYEYTLDMTFGAEIINPYGDAMVNGSEVTLYGTMDYRVHGVNHVLGFPLVVSLAPVGANGYDYNVLLESRTYAGFTEAVNTMQDLEIVSLRITTAVLKNGGNNVDYSRLKEDEAMVGVPVLTSGVNEGRVNCAWRVNDPRQNLHVADWHFEPNVAASSMRDIAGISTPGVQNSGVSFATEGDAEAGSTVATISTCYIRNAPMQSPWELGCIHRGAKWETINLKKYNASAKNVGGIGLYEDGDANILDQVKMISDNWIYGKVNMNINDPDGTTGAADVLRALFQDIWVNQNYANPGDQSGDRVTSGEADALAAALIAYGNANPIPDYRVQVMGVSAFTDDSLGLNQTTDARKEAIIGKFINLTKAAPLGVESDKILAQAIKDVGGPSGGTVTVVKEVFENGSWTTKTVSARHEQFDDYADEILAEAKVDVEYWHSPITHKWRIKSYEFPED